MSRKWLKIALILFAAATLCAGLAACTPQEEAPYDFIVLFDYNEPTPAEGQTRRSPAAFGLTEEDPHLTFYPGKTLPGGVKLNSETFATQFVEDGEWYLPAEIGDDGEPVREEDGTVKLGEKWDFDDPEKNIVDGDITLYANLRLKPRIFLMDGDDVAVTYYGLPGTTIMKPIESAANYPAVDGKTYYECYTDESFETVFGWDYTFDAAEDKYVYGRFLDGIWTIVKTAQEFNGAAVDANIWLDNDITFTSDVPYVAGGTYSGELNGNGHTIKGIDVTIKGSRSTYYGILYNILRPTAYIHDVTFKNVQATVDFPFSTELPSVGFFARRTYANTRIEKVTVTGELKEGDIKVSREHLSYYAGIIEDQRTDKSGLDVSGVTVPMTE